MSEQEKYSIKEYIGEFRTEVIERFDKVDAAQEHTNGTVKEHTITLAMMKGGLAIISIIVIPLIVYVWNQNININKRVDTLTPIHYENVENNTK